MSEIANAKAPPYPKNDILQRATMGKNTLRRQLERAIQQQTEYEQSSVAKLEAARRKREAEAQKKLEEESRARAAREEEQRRLAEQRRTLAEQEREWRERKLQEAEEARKSDSSSEEEQGDREASSKKRTTKARKRKNGKVEEEEGVGQQVNATVEDETRGNGLEDDNPNKKRRLSRKAFPDDSDEESGAVLPTLHGDGGVPENMDVPEPMDTNETLDAEIPVPEENVNSHVDDLFGESE